ncbi:MAG: aspartate aminotransferase family protein [Clostridiales bacterium]|nr:aspartate aminotransferase family protein [Clostridiales bacterium]
MNTIEKGKKYVMNTYNRFPIALDHGDGMYVWDENGKKYLDFLGGIAVNSVGHNNPVLAETISNQAKRLIHCSNLYWTKPMADFAEKIINEGDLDRVFFCNSGAESIEAALKLARKFGAKTGRQEIITMEHSFHGRTFAAVTATGQSHYHNGFGDMLPHIKYAKFNDIDSVKNAVTENTCAILMEPLQGEGGIHPAEKEFLLAVRALCDEKDIKLIFDEVQCGCGRLGTYFAYQTFGVVPDALCMAKGIAGGLPMGAMLAKEEFAECFAPGDHASTFGGGPLATSCANTVFDLLHNGILDNVNKNGAYLTQCLEELKKAHPAIIDVRGIGYMQGAELNTPVAPVISAAIEKGLLLANAGQYIIRFVPSLIAEKEHIDKAVSILDEALKAANL